MNLEQALNAIQTERLYQKLRWSIEGMEVSQTPGNCLKFIDYYLGLATQTLTIVAEEDGCVEQTMEILRKVVTLAAAHLEQKRYDLAKMVLNNNIVRLTTTPQWDIGEYIIEIEHWVAKAKQEIRQFGCSTSSFELILLHGIRCFMQFGVPVRVLPAEGVVNARSGRVMKPGDSF